MPLAAVIGAGPSGFYAAEQLLQAGLDVDLYDALPSPFGLVRAGVAPDHPKIKSVTRIYERTAAHPRFRFFGGVELGADVDRAELLERYSAVVYAFGAATDRALGVPGEDRPGSVAATDFVAWYNGHPSCADRDFDLSGRRAVVIGNGNVALDVARMLVLDPDELERTDAADHAIAAFRRSAIREVLVVGRRGPAQAAFTNPELRELGELRRADVVVDPAALGGEADPGDATARRNVELLRGYAGRPAGGRSHSIELRFLRSPVALLGSGDRGPVTGIELAVTRLEPDGAGGMRAVPTGRHEVVDCGLVVRAIGYRGSPIGDVPFDEHRGVIRNASGRVVDADGVPMVGEYAVGWIKRGPTGVIGTNKKDAAETTARLLDDAARGLLDGRPVGDREEIGAWLRDRVDRLVTWEGWQAIDAHERRAGEPHDRPRVKLVRVSDMLRVGLPDGTSGDDARGAAPAHLGSQM